MSRIEIIIEPNKTIKHRWAELWQYRDLFFLLAWRDILVRYKQTAIGIFWSILRPFLVMVVFSIIFGKIAKLPSDDIPYPLLVFAAMLPWQFFSQTLTDASNSVISNSQLISKVYFPRIIIPTTAMVTSLIDFFISFIILFILMICFGFFLSYKICFLPFLLLIAILTSLGVGYIISALNVTYRDFRYIVPFIVQLGLYISPVGFSSDIVPENWRIIYSLNPMVGVIDGFRWCFLGKSVSIYWPGFIISVVFSISIFIAGIHYFNKAERSFADII